jgi:heat shock protein 5
MDDEDLKRDVKHWRFLVQEKNGKPIITVTYKGEERGFVR